MHSRGEKLPDRLYFRIGEVSDLVGVKPYVLRYWETEFTDIKPTKSKSGQRLYKRRDVEMLLKIKELLYEERFTINGAKQRLKEVGRDIGSEKGVASEDIEVKAAPARRSGKPAAKEAKGGGVDRKFLQKLKSDLEWCLSEIKSG